MKKMETRYTGIQPQYFPRLHYFARILNTDIFSIRDDCQFVRKHKYPNGETDKSFQAHTPIKQSHGIQFLNVPTKHEGYKSLAQTSLFNDVFWIKDHLKTLEIAYSKSPHYEKIIGEIAMILQKNHQSLASLNIATILWGIIRLLGKDTVTEKDLTIEYVTSLLDKQKKFRLKSIKKTTESKSVGNFFDMSANEKIVALCKEYSATTDYCGGTGVAAYLDHSMFDNNGIGVVIQDWKCKSYPQQFERKQGFIPNLSIIDLLMNVDTKSASEIIMDDELKNK